MSEPCAFCGGPVNPHDTSTWREVLSWVGGPKRDSAKGRTGTGRYAHTHCIATFVGEGVSTDQTTLDGESIVDDLSAVPDSPPVADSDLPYEEND